MSSQTEINPILNNDTLLNPHLDNVTTLNPNLLGTMGSGISRGTVLLDKYKIVLPLNTSTGEADLFLSSYNEQDYVVKVYRRQQAVKDDVTAVLKSIDSPYVATLYDTGEYNGFPFEVLPYYQNGSLQGKHFDLEQLKNVLVPGINEALRSLHQKGIIHKDLKPSNIMLWDDYRGIAVIDFGISSVLNMGNTMVVTRTGMTPEYSAPEALKNAFLDESDYYSLGITLYELYCGYTPYQNLTSEEIAQYTAVQRIPFPQDMPKELQDLISALTYPDITNRHNKANPNRRWTYEEVKKWCDGEKQPIPGNGDATVQNKAIPAYTFLHQKYADVPSLVYALATNWNDGKKQLYRGLLSGFFKSFDPELAGYCLDAEEEANSIRGQEDLIFWRLLYRINPDFSGFHWKGNSYESIQAFGEALLDSLWNNNFADHYFWDDLLQNRIISQHFVLAGQENAALVSGVSAVEGFHITKSNDLRLATINYFTLAYLLSGKRTFKKDGQAFSSIAELTSFLKTLLDDSYDKFEMFCHQLITEDDTLDSQFEAWLIALGKRKELEAWKTSLQRHDDSNF